MLNTSFTDLEPASQAVGALADWPASTRMDSSLFMRLLDDVDYDILMLDGKGRVLYANRQARQELATRHVLRMHGACLEAMLDWQTELRQNPQRLRNRTAARR